MATLAFYSHVAKLQKFAPINDVLSWIPLMLRPNNVASYNTQ